MKGFRDEEFKMMMNSSSSSSSSSINNDNSNKNEIIIYDGDPVLWSPFITRYHMDLRMRGLSYILNDEEITKILQEPSPPVYQLAHNSWPEDSLSREQRIAYNISIGQSYACKSVSVFSMNLISRAMHINVNRILFFLSALHFCDHRYSLF